MTNTIMLASSEYPYFSQADLQAQGQQKESKSSIFVKKPQISRKMLVTFDTEAEGLIQEYIWIDQG